MSDDDKGDKGMRDALLRAWPDDGPAPDFAAVITAAERELARNRRRYGILAASAATVAAVAITVSLLTPDRKEVRFVEPAELLGSTSWSAPSDFLLPAREFDVYRDLPALPASTDTEEGALL